MFNKIKGCVNQYPEQRSHVIVLLRLLLILFHATLIKHLSTQQNMWSNFHTHSNYCDGKADISEYVRKAEQLNMVSLGFSSHAPLPFPCKWCMKSEDMDLYLNSISKMQQENSSIQIFKGLEVDYIPNVISPDDFNDRLDYTVGSIHFVEQLPDGTRWEIDGQHNFFLEGFEKEKVFWKKKY